MTNWSFLRHLTRAICEVGTRQGSYLPIREISHFNHYFDEEGNIKTAELDTLDGDVSRREVLTRYLLLGVVLDQGPDIEGVRYLLKESTERLYRRGIRFLHSPIQFFQKIDLSIDEILASHKLVKEFRSEIWARENNSFSAKYNLFFAQSMRGLVSSKQVLDYVVHRWGVPLFLPLLLEKDIGKKGGSSFQPLVDYVESYPSGERMSRGLKENERYGLGSAIGDKACHLFAKFYISIFNLVEAKRGDPGWTGFSYELPLDSNAGRVLFRTGFLLELCSLEDLVHYDVVQKGKGKKGTNYLRITNLRGKRINRDRYGEDLFEDYKVVIREFMKMGRPRSGMEIQRIPNLLLYKLYQSGYKSSIAELDEGLIYIGTNYCYNHDKPDCGQCPINRLCKAYNGSEILITEYRT